MLHFYRSARQQVLPVNLGGVVLWRQQGWHELDLSFLLSLRTNKLVHYFLQRVLEIR